MRSRERYLELKNIINNVKCVKLKSNNNLILTNLEKDDTSLQL